MFPLLPKCFWNSRTGEWSQGVQCVGKALGIGSSPPLTKFPPKEFFLGKNIHRASENLDSQTTQEVGFGAGL